MEEGPEIPKPGDKLAGKYELVRLIGKGGMGVVFEAKHLRLKQRVAIKILKPELLAHQDCVSRFEREGRAAARITCQNVARVYDVDVSETGLPFMVIEFLEGNDLSAELTHRPRLPIMEAVDVVIQACSAMAEAHSLGIVHRDLKPANLFLTGKMTLRTVKVLDFGISKVFADEDALHQTTPSLALGTPHYMSPEQILASRDVDARSDIWSLGVILYKVLSGRFPFEGDSATALVVAVATSQPAPLASHTNVPPGLAAAVMKALEKERDERWSRVEDFARAIEPFGSGRVKFVPVHGRISGDPPAPPPGMGPAAMELMAPTLVDQSAPEMFPTEGNWTQSPLRPKKTRWKYLAGGTVAAMLGVGALVVGFVRSHGPASSTALVPPPPASTEVAPPPAASPLPPAAPTPSPPDPSTEPSKSVTLPDSKKPKQPVTSTKRTPTNPGPTATAQPPTNAAPTTTPKSDPVHL